MSYSVLPSYTRGTLADLRGLGEDADAIREAIAKSERAMIAAAKFWRSAAPRLVLEEYVSHEKIQLGDVVRWHGFTAVVLRIVEWPNVGNEKAPITYGFYVAYLDGDLSTYRYFRSNVCNGCFIGELAYIQGNRLAMITRQLFDCHYPEG